MIKNFDELLKEAKKMDRKIISVAVAQDEDVLNSIEKAYNEGLIDAILVGDKVEIEKIAQKNNIDLSKFQIIDETDEVEACRIAVQKVTNKEADMIMKGLVHTSIILKAILNKEANLRTGRVLSHVCLADIESYDKLLFITDGGMNISPGIDEKAQITENTVSVAHSLGIDEPIVAVLAAKEDINPKMMATIHASELEKMNKEGIIKGCTVIGPLAMDNAVSVKAAKQKGITKYGAGKADILIMPNIESGNIMLKTLTFLANAKSAGIIVGSKAPVIVTSRADDDMTKLHSIALGMFISEFDKK